MIRSVTEADIDGAILLASVLASNEIEDIGCNIKPHCDTCRCDHHCKHKYEWHCAAAALGVSATSVDLWFDASGDVEQLCDGESKVAIIASGDDVWGIGITDDEAIADARRNAVSNTNPFMPGEWDTLGFVALAVTPVQTHRIIEREIYKCSEIGIEVVRDGTGRILSAMSLQSLFWTNRTGREVDKDLEAAELLRDGWLPLGWAIDR